MTDAFKCELSEATTIDDPTTGSGTIATFTEALGATGRPFIIHVEDPPNKTRSRHYHHGDVIYFYTRGEHHIEGEGTYRAGDVRWTRKGHAYGPETTGDEGGSWWVISYQDPTPVDVVSEDTDAPSGEPNSETNVDAGELPHFSRPYNWEAIDLAVKVIGGAILEEFLGEDEISTLDQEIDTYLLSGNATGQPDSGAEIYDVFLGHNTLRLHGLVEKLPSSGDLIAREELVTWVERMLKPQANSVLLNAGELIQIQPGEPAQYPHRDSDSWPIPIGEEPVMVNAIVALDPFTTENGATYIAPKSWQWDEQRQPKTDEYARAVMKRGDAVFFRGDCIHGGGENTSDKRRRAISLSYCAGWLRPVENSFLNIPKSTVTKLSRRLQALLGYTAHDASDRRGGLVGLYENGDPSRALKGDATI